MTVPATTRRVGPHLGNGVTTSFPFSFKVFDAGDIEMTRVDADGISYSLSLGTHYSVTLNADQDASPGGTITYPLSGDPLATGETLVGVGALPYDQPTDLPSGGAYRALTVENAFDRTVQQIQQLAELQGRALTLPASAATADTALPAPAANKVIGWNETGDALTNYSPADLATVVVAGTSYFQTFNGNGSQTQFVLTADPGSVNALDIALDGVPQKNGIDFTVSGTTLAFTSAPAAGTQNIAVRYVAAVPVGSANAQDVTYSPDGTGAVNRNLQKKLREAVSVFDFMTEAQIADVCSATPALDHTAALQAAINAAQVLGQGTRRLLINSTLAGYYRITAPLVVSGNFLTVEWDSTNAIIKKFFNGDMFQVYGGDVEFNRCGLDGNGAAYTGGGIRLMSASANSFRLINPRIKETASAPLLIEANAGSLMKVIGGLLQPYNAAAAGPTHGVAMTGTDTSPANRKLIGVSMGGAPIMDATGAETVQILGCDGSKITTSSASKKISAVGNRMQTAGANVTISGVDNCFVGNMVASSFELASGAANSVVKENVTVGAEVIDSSGNTGNKVAIFGSSYTPGWTGSGSNPSLGNGTLTGLYDRNDRHVTVTVDLTIGSTTTLGTGEYSFGLPLQAVSGRSFVGSAWLNDAGTAFYVGTVLVVAGSTTAQVYFNAGASAMSPTVPIALANGDRLRFELTYVPT